MRRLLFLFITVIFISCADNSNNYTFKGTALGFADNTKIFLHEVDQNNQPIIVDTLIVKNEAFEKEYEKIDDASLHFLTVENMKGNVIFFVENENLNAKIYADSLGASYVTGGKQNELYNEFTKAMKSFSKRKASLSQGLQNAQAQQDELLFNELRNENLALAKEENNYKRDFVKNNSNSVFSLMLLTELFKNNDFTATEASKIIEALNPKMAAHPITTQLKITIESAKKAEIGGIAPNFQAPTPDGEMLSLTETLGTYTIIDFWASWCKPCRMENPNVVKVYEKYHDKGLNIISVSLDRDGQKDRWIKAIEDDNMDWYHVSNLKFWQDPIARQYNVRSIPATFLLDAEGKIIDKNLRGPALEQRIAQLLD